MQQSEKEPGFTTVQLRGHYETFIGRDNSTDENGALTELFDIR